MVCCWILYNSMHPTLNVVWYHTNFFLCCICGRIRSKTCNAKGLYYHRVLDFGWGSSISDGIFNMFEQQFAQLLQWLFLDVSIDLDDPWISIANEKIQGQRMCRVCCHGCQKKQLIEILGLTCKNVSCFGQHCYWRRTWLSEWIGQW